MPKITPLRSAPKAASERTRKRQIPSSFYNFINYLCVMRKLLFTLLCLPLIGPGQTILLEEDFEGLTFPLGWTQATNSSDGGWLLGTNTLLQSQWWSMGAHGRFIATNDDECDCDKTVDYLIMPPFDLTNLTSAVLQFQSYFDAGSLNGGALSNS